MLEIAGKVIAINIRDDSDCQSFYYFSGKTRVFKNIIKSNPNIFYKEGRKTDLATQIENLYKILTFICAKKLDEVKKYLQRTMI